MNKEKKRQEWISFAASKEKKEKQLNLDSFGRKDLEEPTTKF